MTSPIPPGGDGSAADPKAAALQLLRERYRQTIAKTLDVFRQLASQLALSPSASELLDTLRRELHRVRGSAGSYGYSEASRLAEQLEQRALRWAADPTLETEQRSVIISHFASALELAFRMGEAPAEQERAIRTLLLVSPVEAMLEPARQEAQLRGYRLAVLERAQLSPTLLQDLDPHVVGVRPGDVETVGPLVWPRGIPLVVLEDRPEEERTAAPVAANARLDVADLTAGAGELFDVAERMLLRRGTVGSTVLALDDDPSILAMVRYFLEGPQLRVVTIDDPAQLLDSLRQLRPSLLLMDIQMPGYNGIELTRQVRASPAGRDLPIVLLSGEIDPESRGSAHEAGADEFISKPIAAPQLRARVFAELERYRLERLAAGIHPATGLPMPDRTHRAAELALAEERTAERELTFALVRPVQETLADDVATAAWLRETSRIAVALGDQARVLGFHDYTSLLVALPGSAAQAMERFAELDASRAADAPAARVGLVSSTDLPDETLPTLFAALEESVSLVAGDAGVSVHHWQRDDAFLAPDVVLVEDDAALSEMLQYALRANGFTFRAFANGRIALDALLRMKTHGRRPFVLLDIDLPGMDGYSLHERVRVERPGEYAYVYITAHAAEPDQLRALRSGAVDFIPKPLNLRVLMAKMASWSATMGKPT